MNSYDDYTNESGYANENNHYNDLVIQKGKSTLQVRRVCDHATTRADGLQFKHLSIHDNQYDASDTSSIEEMNRDIEATEKAKVEPYHHGRRFPCSLNLPQMPLTRSRGDVYCSPPSVISELSDHSSPYTVRSVSSYRTEEEFNDAEQYNNFKIVHCDTPTFERHNVEVGTDLLPMAGVDETSHAHIMGDTIDTDCIQCKTVLFSKKSASMVICPICRCVSPIEVTSNTKPVPKSDIHVGIGLTIEFVLALQA